MEKALRNLECGESATISAVRAPGELGRRIRDMGLIPGTDVLMLARAPLRDPVALKIANTTISLRNSEADFITVAS